MPLNCTKKGNEVTSRLTQGTQEEPNSTSPPTTPSCLAPPQVVCVAGGGRRHNLGSIPQIQRHLRLTQVKFSLLQRPRVSLSGRRCITPACFYNRPPSRHRRAPQSSPAFPALGTTEPEHHTTLRAQFPGHLARAIGPAFGGVLGPPGNASAQSRRLPGSHVGARGGLSFLTCIPGTRTATGEWAMKAIAAPRCFGAAGASGWDWLLLQG